MMSDPIKFLTDHCKMDVVGDMVNISHKATGANIGSFSMSAAKMNQSSGSTCQCGHSHLGSCANCEECKKNKKDA